MSHMRYPGYFNIIPVKDKKPLVSWKDFTDREQTAEEKQNLLKLYPNGNVGFVTGKVSRILVLDDDGGLNLEKYKVPKTWTAKTPRGGRHYYFRWNDSLNDKVTTKTEIFTNVDVRGNGGYVVFYGFDFPFITRPLANPPQWLIDLLPNKYDSQIENKNVEVANKSYLQELLSGIKPGNRNDSFTRIAGSLRSRGYSGPEIFEFLQARASDVGFELAELKTICDSISRYEPKQKIEESQASSIDTFLKDIETVDWIVPGMIAKKSIGFVAGLPQTNKTWMLIDLAIECVKGGGLWLGKFPVNKAKVLFIDQERFRGETQRRFKAVIASNTISTNSLKELYVKSGTTIRLNLQHSFDAFRKELSELRPDLVIVDSFATFSTVEENNRKDIQVVLEKIKELRNEFNCTFLFIHHENKNAFDKEGGEPSISQMAGSIAIPAAAETVFTVRKQDGDSSMVFHTKSTLASTILPFMVKVTDQDEAKTKIKVEAF